MAISRLDSESRSSAELENPLAAGRHFLHCGVQSSRGGGVYLYVHNALDFVIYGKSEGIVAPRYEIEARLEDGPLP